MHDGKSSTLHPGLSSEDSEELSVSVISSSTDDCCSRSRFHMALSVSVLSSSTDDRLSGNCFDEELSVTVVSSSDGDPFSDDRFPRKPARLFDLLSGLASLQ